MSIIPLDKLEQLRREQQGEEQEERPVLYAPTPEPLEMLSGSIEPEEERGVTIIDFTI
tara:strand:+ start:261 stop:434 length:174 start_codon:yes stop_codon:yes gene_type:complete